MNYSYHIGGELMPNVAKISIALPAEMVEVVRQAVETGEYASSSEVVRDALRDWTQKRSKRHQQAIDELRQAWQQAMDDKSPGVPVKGVLNRLDRKYRDLAKRSNNAG
jgi:antitoxin ParD1/3/4